MAEMGTSSHCLTAVPSMKADPFDCLWMTLRGFLLCIQLTIPLSLWISPWRGLVMRAMWMYVIMGKSSVVGPTRVVPYLSFMYKMLFCILEVRLSFTPFECAILQALNVALTQLHPNGWGFVWAFAILCRGLGCEPTVGLFFSFFQAKSMKKDSWLSVNNQSCGSILIAKSQSYKDFKESFFKVRAGPTCPGLLVDPSGKEKFPLYWTTKPRAKLGHDFRRLLFVEKEDLSMLEWASPMKCAHLLEHEDNEESLFVFLCISRLLSPSSTFPSWCFVYTISETLFLQQVRWRWWPWHNWRLQMPRSRKWPCPRLRL